MIIEEKFLSKIQKMDSVQILELIVTAKTGGEYDKPLKVRIVYRAHTALKNLLNDISRASGSGIRDESAFVTGMLKD